MKYIVIAAIALLLVGCQYIPASGRRTTSRDSNWVIQHIRVDDEVIDKGYPFDIIEPVYWTANIYDGEAEYNKSLAGFTREQRLIFAIEWYFMEVENGGHDQFYSNSTGIVWNDALAGFKEMGVEEAVAILQESAKRIGGNPSLDRATRQKQMDTFKPQFDDLDDRLYTLEDGGILDGIMQTFIKTHRKAFYFEGDVKKPKSLVK